MKEGRKGGRKEKKGEGRMGGKGREGWRKGV
jgi:hypothetical protein